MWKNAPLGDLRTMRRALAVYISQRDMAQLFIKSIETADIRDNLGVPFQIFYGISDNPHAIWSIANARRVIGYDPQDNSEERFFFFSLLFRRTWLRQARPVSARATGATSRI